ncbi:ABC transporter ATP-binding protein [Asaia spathodeae]|uniref:ABC transporter ATP-binding protein n=1 Tax=Asaia spathodeae TaxID=657016 RepID=UPI002FC3925A
MTAILRCSDLCVAYGGRPVLSSVSLSLGVGFHGLWGANGTGKSTLLRMLSGSARPDHGDVWINGKHLVRDDVAARQGLAYVPDEAAVYPFMTGHDLMALCAWARKAPDIAPPIIEGFGLAPHLDKRYDALSLGTRRKMLIASAFIGEPSLLLMDEPANGLDAQSHAFFGALLAEKSRTACVLLSTHDGAFLETMGATIIRQESLGAS